MSISRSKHHKEYAMLGVVLFITLIGLAIRIAPALQTSFPLNDGGLFYHMIVELQESQYSLPQFTTYNKAKIPFAYPPLAFYLAGLLADLLRISLLEIMRVLPALVSTLSIPAFFLLARELTKSKLQVIFGVFAFALLPRVFAWHIMGGGITRSFGLLFALLTMVFAYRFYKDHASRNLLFTILLGTLTMYTHPEATVHTAISALVFFLWIDRSRKGFTLSLGIAAAILTLTSPWWGLAISRHGLEPFLASINAAGQDSLNPVIGIFIFFRFMFTDEAYLPILSVLGLIGLFVSLARKSTLFPAWMFIMHLIEPRGGTLFMMIPLALMIGYAIEAVIIPFLNKSEKPDSPPESIQGELEQVLRGKVTRYFILFVFAYGLMSAYNTGQKIKDQFSLNPLEMETFDWVRENTPEDSQFFLITRQHPLRDAWSEWFPVLAGRRSLATVFGYEWLNDGLFGDRIDAYKKLQACAYKEPACLDEWYFDPGSNSSYVLIWNRTDPMQYPLSIYLKQSSTFALVYQNETTVVFHKHE